MGKQGITSGLVTTEVRQSQLLKRRKLRTVPKATGIQVLTSRYLISLTVLVKVVSIRSILYPQKVCTSREKKSSILTKIAKNLKQGLPWLSEGKLAWFSRIASPKLLQNSTHGFMSLHGSICFKMTSMYFLSQNKSKGRILNVLQEANLDRRER